MAELTTREKLEHLAEIAASDEKLKILLYIKNKVNFLKYSHGERLHSEKILEELYRDIVEGKHK